MNCNDFIGTLGVGTLLVAYFLNLFSFIKKEGQLYFILNIIGAGIACFASVLIQFFPFIILEATWVVVSVVGLIKTTKKSQA